MPEGSSSETSTVQKRHTRKATSWRGSSGRSIVVTLQPDSVGGIPAVYADVEERPFQGRVTNDDDGLQPWWSSLECNNVHGG
jgi:hypothetical protein